MSPAVLGAPEARVIVETAVAIACGVAPEDVTMLTARHQAAGDDAQQGGALRALSDGEAVQEPATAVDFAIVTASHEAGTTAARSLTAAVSSGALLRHLDEQGMELDGVGLAAAVRVDDVEVEAGDGGGSDGGTDVAGQATVIDPDNPGEQGGDGGIVDTLLQVVLPVLVGAGVLSVVGVRLARRFRAANGGHRALSVSTKSSHPRGRVADARTASSRFAGGHTATPSRRTMQVREFSDSDNDDDDGVYGNGRDGDASTDGQQSRSLSIVDVGFSEPASATSSRPGSAARAALGGAMDRDGGGDEVRGVELPGMSPQHARGRGDGFRDGAADAARLRAELMQKHLNPSKQLGARTPTSGQLSGATSIGFGASAINLQMQVTPRAPGAGGGGDAGDAAPTGEFGSKRSRPGSMRQILSTVSNQVVRTLSMGSSGSAGNSSKSLTKAASSGGGDGAFGTATAPRVAASNETPPSVKALATKNKTPESLGLLAHQHLSDSEESLGSPLGGAEAGHALPRDGEVASAAASFVVADGDSGDAAPGSSGTPASGAAAGTIGSGSGGGRGGGGEGASAADKPASDSPRAHRGARRGTVELGSRGDVRRGTRLSRGAGVKASSPAQDAPKVGRPGSGSSSSESNASDSEGSSWESRSRSSSVDSGSTSGTSPSPRPRRAMRGGGGRA